MKRSLETIIREDYNNNAVAYAKNRYPHKSVNQIERANYVLWRILRERGQLNEIPRQRAEFGPDTWQCYLDNWFGYSRYQLRCASPSFYNRMRREGLLKRIPLLDKKEVAKGRKKYLPTALAYCRRELSDKNRGQIRKEYPSVYTLLRKEGTLKYIPLNGKSRV